MKVLQVLAAPLPPKCYKEVGGSGADLTDIKPAALNTVITLLFGPYGIGWGVDYDPALFEAGEKQTISRRVDVWYAVVEGEETRKIVCPVPTFNQNPKAGYSLKGAITTAIGSVFSRLGWQGLVYMGSLDHKNAAAVYAKAGAHPFEREILLAVAVEKDEESGDGGGDAPKPKAEVPQIDLTGWSPDNVEAVKGKWIEVGHTLGYVAGTTPKGAEAATLIKAIGEPYGKLDNAKPEELRGLGVQGVENMKKAKEA